MAERQIRRLPSQVVEEELQAVLTPRELSRVVEEVRQAELQALEDPEVSQDLRGAVQELEQAMDLVRSLVGVSSAGEGYALQPERPRRSPVAVMADRELQRVRGELETVRQNLNTVQRGLTVERERNEQRGRLIVELRTEIEVLRRAREGDRERLLQLGGRPVDTPSFHPAPPGESASLPGSDTYGGS